MTCDRIAGDDGFGFGGVGGGGGCGGCHNLAASNCKCSNSIYFDRPSLHVVHRSVQRELMIFSIVTSMKMVQLYCIYFPSMALALYHSLAYTESVRDDRRTVNFLLHDRSSHPHHRQCCRHHHHRCGLTDFFFSCTCLSILLWSSGICFCHSMLYYDGDYYY